MPRTKRLISRCCNATARVITGDEGTSYWLCGNCQNGCDLKSRVKHVKPPVDPTSISDEEAKKFAGHLESIATYNRSGTKCEDMFEHESFEQMYGKCRPCPEDCKGDEKHLHIAYASTTPQPVPGYTNKTSTEEAIEELKRICENTGYEWFIENVKIEVDKKSKTIHIGAASGYKNRTCFPSFKKSTVARIWFRRFMLVVLGGLIVLAWQKFQYHACHEAIYNILFLKK